MYTTKPNAIQSEVLATHLGQTLSLTEWADALGLNRDSGETRMLMRLQQHTLGVLRSLTAEACGGAVPEPEAIEGARNEEAACRRPS